MANDGNTVQELAALLEEAGAKPRVRSDRVVRSTLYDLDYHIALIACVFFETEDKGTVYSRSVETSWLKILQFIAVRPALLPDFKRWARERRQPDLDTWQMMPRGYIGDNTHDRTVELLLARQVLVRKLSGVTSGQRFVELKMLYENLVAKDLLRSERDTLRELADMRVNKTLLSGK